MLKLDITGFTAEEILNYALAGLLARHQHMAARIAEIRGQLSGTPAPASAPPVRRGPGRPAATATPPGPRPAPAQTPVRRALSPEARANIIAAQKKRWAKVHKAKRAADKLAAAPSQGRRRMQLAPDPDPDPEPALAAAGD